MELRYWYTYIYIYYIIYSLAKITLGNGRSLVETRRSLMIPCFDIILWFETKLTRWLLEVTQNIIICPYGSWLTLSDDWGVQSPLKRKVFRFRETILRRDHYPPEVELFAPEKWWDWKTILSYWAPVSFQGWTVKLWEGKWSVFGESNNANVC